MGLGCTCVCWSIELHNDTIIYFFSKDIPENGADVAHLQTVHETGVQAGMGVNYNLSKWLGRIITHHWEVHVSASYDTIDNVIVWYHQ